MWTHLEGRRRRIVLSLAIALLVWPGLASGQKRGGTAVLAIDSNPLTLNPAITSGDPDHMVGEKIYGALIYLDDNFAPKPDLAVRWEVAPDGLSYRFDLRPNVKWHDGQPFSSADVKYTFEEVLAKYHPLSKNTFQRIAAVETPDPLKVVIRMKEPFGPFLSIIFSFNAPIIPKHIYGGTDVLSNAANSRPVGTGPFKFHEWIRGDRITLVRNDAYYHPVQLDRLILKIIPDAAARTLAFESGDVDYIADYYLAKSDVARLEKLRDTKVRRGGDLPIDTLLGFNIRQRPLAVPEVRHAIVTAIDRKLIVDKARFGLGIPGRSEVDGHFAWAYNPKIDYGVMYAFNPSKAKTLLDAAGYRPGPDGKRMSLRLIYNVARPVLAQIAEIMKSQLADVGIELRLEAVERALWIDRVWMKYDFDLHLFEGGTFGDPALGVQRWYLCADEARRLFAVNATGYCNPTVDELFKRAATEIKVSDRARYYFQVQEILARDLPHLLLIENENVDVAKAYLRGVWAGKMQYSQWEGVWIDK